MTPRTRINAAAFLAAGTLAGAALAAPTAGVAQDAATLPLVKVTATAKTAAVTGAETLTAGPTQLSLSTPAHRTIAIVQLKPGKTAADLKAAIAASKMSASPVFKVARLLGGGGSTGGRPYVFTTDLSAGTYEVVDDTERPTIESEFTVAAGTSNVRAPAAAATIDLYDFKMTASAPLPATGAVKVVNHGPSPHFVAIARLKKATDGPKVVALLRKKGGEMKAQKLLDAASAGGLADLLSPGVTDVVQTDGLKPGKYLIACFYADEKSHGKEHSMLGMERVVTVR